jgi:integrase
VLFSCCFSIAQSSHNLSIGHIIDFVYLFSVKSCMVQLSTNTLVLRERELRLVRRSGTGYWQVHYKIGQSKIWLRKTTGTVDVKEATQFAEDTFHEARILEKKGMPVTSKKFKAVAEALQKRLEAEIEAGTAKPAIRDSAAAIKNYLIPFFGAYNVDRITPAVIAEFHEWRRDKVGYELRASTQANHNAALNRVFDEAIAKGYMTDYLRPALKNTGGATERRPTFEHSELVQLLASIPAWIADGRQERTKWIRQLMQLYVPFVANTGVRPGTETEFLEWRNISKLVKDSVDYLVIDIQRTKTKPRQLIAHHSCWQLLEKLKDMQPDLQALTMDELLKKKLSKRLFSLQDGSQPDNFNHPFSNLLEFAELLKCSITGKERSLYSLRHYYATQKLLQGVAIHDLARQMGTSAIMIEKHYSHMTSLMRPEQFAGNGSGGNELTEQVKSISSANVANANMMQLAEMATGISLQLNQLNPTEHQRLKQALKSSSKSN